MVHKKIRMCVGPVKRNDLVTICGAGYSACTSCSCLGRQVGVVGMLYCFSVMTFCYYLYGLPLVAGYCVYQ